jgi:hypothetical protein
MQIHPLAYIVKLNIEMSMAELIAKVSIGANTNESLFVDADHPKPQSGENKRRYIPIEFKPNPTDAQLSNAFGTSTDVRLNWAANSDATLDKVLGRSTSNDTDISMNMRREVHVLVERRNSLGSSYKQFRDSSGNVSSVSHSDMEDEYKLLRKVGEERAVAEGNLETTFTGVDKQMGVYTQVWALKQENS